MKRWVVLVVLLAGCADAPADGADTTAPTSEPASTGDGSDTNAGLAPNGGHVAFSAEGMVLLPVPIRCFDGTSAAELDGDSTPWHLDIPANALADVRINLTFEDPRAQDLNLYLELEGQVLAGSGAVNVNGEPMETIHAPALSPGHYDLVVVGCLGVAAPYALDIQGTWTVDG